MMPKERKKVKSDFGINQCLPRKEKKTRKKKNASVSASAWFVSLSKISVEDNF